MRGFQLWINLPASEKMNAPAYQEFGASRIPVESRDGCRIKIIAGTSSGGTAGPVSAPHVDARYFDVEIDPGGIFNEPLPGDHAAFFVVYEGEATAASDDGPREVPALSLVALGPGEKAELAGGANGARAILLAARPLHEPVAWSGPFVMNTREELLQAFDDYRQGRF